MDVFSLINGSDYYYNSLLSMSKYYPCFRVCLRHRVLREAQSEEIPCDPEIASF